MRWGQENKDERQVSGMEDDTDESGDHRACPSREHNPPMHMYIPPGKRYRHVCPIICGKVTIMRSQSLTWKTSI